MPLLRWIVLALLIWWVFRRLERYLGLRSGGARPPERPTPRPRPADPWEVLGVDRNASQREIRRAFHQRMSEYHPDKVRDLGSELQDLASEKAKQISAAYQKLKQR